MNLISKMIGFGATMVALMLLIVSLAYFNMSQMSTALSTIGEVGMPLSDSQIKFACTGENFSQQFRNHMVNRLGDLAAREDIISFYGCTRYCIA